MKLDRDIITGDITGGITAGVVALPLALALGVASGLGPMAGIYGAIAVGFFAALVRLRKSPVQQGQWSSCWRACLPVCLVTLR